MRYPSEAAKAAWTAACAVPALSLKEAMRAGADSLSSIDAAAHSNRRGSEGAAISKVRSLEKPSSSSDGDAAWSRGERAQRASPAG